MASAADVPRANCCLIYEGNYLRHPGACPDLGIRQAGWGEKCVRSGGGYLWMVDLVGVDIRGTWVLRRWWG
jgi:hypothetical protein